MTRFIPGALVLMALCAAPGCGGGSASSSPTPPTTIAPQPTPTPTPVPDNLKQETYCVPAPPPTHSLRVKVHSDFGYKKVLDSRPLVGPNVDHCGSIAYPGTVCVTRNEDDAQAVTCNNLATGKAEDTGRYGPTWKWNDQPCRPASQGGNEPGCRNHETNQFLVYAFGPGIYVACATNGACGVDRINVD